MDGGSAKNPLREREREREREYKELGGIFPPISEPVQVLNFILTQVYPMARPKQ